MVRVSGRSMLFNATFSNISAISYWGHGCRGRMVVRFTTTCAISDYYTSSNSVHCKVYAIMFVSDLWQVAGFLPVLR
jgi:hypothetical protein